MGLQCQRRPVAERSASPGHPAPATRPRRQGRHGSLGGVRGPRAAPVWRRREHGGPRSDAVRRAVLGAVDRREEIPPGASARPYAAREASAAGSRTSGARSALRGPASGRRRGRRRRSMPSAARFATAVGVGAKSQRDRWSAMTRLISSGMRRSKERRPASTCATGTCNLAAASAPEAWSSCRHRRGPHRAARPRGWARERPASPLSVGRDSRRPPRANDPAAATQARRRSCRPSRRHSAGPYRRISPRAERAGPAAGTAALMSWGRVPTTLTMRTAGPSAACRCRGRRLVPGRARSRREFRPSSTTSSDGNHAASKSSHAGSSV